ncbi:MAG TPA: SRPBCC domain-containing protein [Flavisolibacter sp.]|jgi:uncharacterized protein YndB with AHSA1/START domain|nr:SRPBCC domain-containing protein [Flavisolibacter sp.]
MTQESVFDFIVNKPEKKVLITMEFDADLPLVWDAFTKQEILDQWYAPKPYSSRTKSMDFKVGGRRFYAMVSPDGLERWAVQRYTSISPKTNFKFFNVFTDENENPDPHGSDWDLNFSEQEGRTRVHISIYNESMERMESLMEGFKIGYKMTYENLKEVLAALVQKQKQA